MQINKVNSNERTDLIRDVDFKGSDGGINGLGLTGTPPSFFQFWYRWNLEEYCMYLNSHIHHDCS